MKSRPLQFILKYSTFFTLVFLLVLGKNDCLQGQAGVLIYSTDFGDDPDEWPEEWNAVGSNTWTLSLNESSIPSPPFSGDCNLLSGTGLIAKTVILDNDLSSEEYSEISILWGARRAYVDSVSCEWSSDGNNWNLISFNDVQNNATWAWVNNETRIELPANAIGVSDLLFKWTYDSNTNPDAYRIDDFSIEGCKLPETAGPINGSNEVCKGHTYEYSILDINADTYNWNYSGNGANYSGTTDTLEITFSNSATSGELTVYGYNECGDGIGDTLWIDVYDELIADDITGDNTHICYDSLGGTLEAQPEGGSGNFQIDWLKDGVSTGETGLSYILPNLTQDADYSYVVTDLECYNDDDTSAIYPIVVYPVFEIGEITGAQDTTICYLDGVGTLTANPSGGSEDYIITWYGTDGSYLGDGQTCLADSLTANIGIYYNVVDECGVGNSDTLWIVVYDQLIAAPITGGPEFLPICYETDGGTLYPNPSGGSQNYTFKWFENEVEVGYEPFHSVGILTTSTVFKYDVEDEVCGLRTSPDKLINVYDEFKANPISGGQTEICVGEDPGTLESNAEGGSEIYTIKWYDTENIEPIGTDETFDVGPLNENKAYYYVVDDSACGSRESDEFNIMVYEMVEASALIEASKYAICPDEEVIFTIDTIIAGGGDSAKIEWRKNGLNILPDTNQYITSELSDGDTIDLRLISTLTCVVEDTVYSNKIVIVVLDAPDPEFIIPIPKPNPENAVPTFLICADPDHTYKWYKNNEIIPEANRQFYYPGRNGIIQPGVNYSVRVEYLNGCANMSNIFSYSPTKSKWFSSFDIAVFPNPNKGLFYLMLNEDAFAGSPDSYMLRIIDMNGKEVMNKEMNGLYNKIDLESRSKGIYFLEVTIAQKKQIHKIVIY